MPDDTRNKIYNRLTNYLGIDKARETIRIG